jgi:hypothetical protein
VWILSSLMFGPEIWRVLLGQLDLSWRGLPCKMTRPDSGGRGREEEGEWVEGGQFVGDGGMG